MQIDTVNEHSFTDLLLMLVIYFIEADFPIKIIFLFNIVWLVNLGWTYSLPQLARNLMEFNLNSLLIFQPKRLSCKQLDYHFGYYTKICVNLISLFLIFWQWLIYSDNWIYCSQSLSLSKTHVLGLKASFFSHMECFIGFSH